MRFTRPRKSLRTGFAILLAATCAPAAAWPFLVGGATALAAEAKDTAEPAGPVGKISKDQATQVALAALPGKVTDATIERKRGKNVWVIEIVSDKDGGETDVLVDMDSGKVIGFDR
jgi:uncharacterized membrane protein YkoI